MNSHKRNLSAEKRIDETLAEFETMVEQPNCEGCIFLRMGRKCGECIGAEVLDWLTPRLKPGVKDD
jgi:hypothetical protein